MATEAFSDLRLRELFAAVGGPGLPGSGSVSSLVGALAAALVAMAARGTTDAWPEAPAAAAQATVLLERLESLVREDAEVFGRALRSLEEPKGDFDLGTALDRAADVPLRIAEVAADVALLAAEVAERCDPRRRADAVAAGTLAAAAAQAAADLVAVNLTALEGDPRVARARRAAGEAARAASAVS